LQNVIWGNKLFWNNAKRLSQRRLCLNLNLQRHNRVKAVLSFHYHPVVRFSTKHFLEALRNDHHRKLFKRPRLLVLRELHIPQIDGTPQGSGWLRILEARSVFAATATLNGIWTIVPPHLIGQYSINHHFLMQSESTKEKAVAPFTRASRANQLTMLAVSCAYSGSRQPPPFGHIGSLSVALCWYKRARNKQQLLADLPALCIYQFAFPSPFADWGERTVTNLRNLLRIWPPCDGWLTKTQRPIQNTNSPLQRSSPRSIPHTHFTPPDLNRSSQVSKSSNLPSSPSTTTNCNRPGYCPPPSPRLSLCSQTWRSF